LGDEPVDDSLLRSAMNDFRRDIASFLSRGFIACLATVSESCEPDICTLIYAQDEQLNLYFKSRTTGRHSLNLAFRERCAVAVYDHDSTYLKKSGVQLLGRAHRITDAQAMEQAVNIYSARFSSAGAKFQPLNDLIRPDAPSTMYKFEPTVARFLHESKHTSDDYVDLN
jgi:uncharacterized protein YhbP (UPF0306 family)